MRESKNRDFLHTDVTDVLGSSDRAFVVRLIEGENNDSEGDSCNSSSSKNDGSGKKPNLKANRGRITKEEKAGGKKGGNGGKKGGSLSLGAKFQRQLKDLVDALEATSPHFVRCLKPNALQRPGKYTRSVTLFKSKKDQQQYKIDVV